MTVPQVPVATHSFRQRYLYGFAPQAEVFHHVRTQALESEAGRWPEILASWTALQPTIASLAERERGLAETIQLMPLPPDCQPTVNAICSDPLFQKTFAHHAISFQMVEVDKLIAAQRSVNLDYAERLQASYPAQPTMTELMDICLSPTRVMEPIQHLEVAPNTHVFSSPNSDIRFLGSFVKPLTPEDLAHAALGGLPAAAIIAFVG